MNNNIKNNFSNNVKDFIKTLEEQPDGILNTLNNDEQKNFLESIFSIMNMIEKISLKMNNQKVVYDVKNLNNEIKNDKEIFNGLNKFNNFLISIDDNFFTNISEENKKIVNYDLQILNEAFKNILLSGVK